MANAVGISKEIAEINKRLPDEMCCDYELKGIDRTKRLNDRDDAAAALWGFTEHHRTIYAGWYKYKFKEEVIELPPLRPGFACLNTITIGLAPNGRYTFANSVHLLTCGRSGPTSVWDTMQYATREDALQAAIEKYRETLAEMLGYGDTAAAHAYANKLRDVLDALSPKQTRNGQLLLF